MDDMSYYDYTLMKSGAQEILNELKNYTAAKKDMDGIVTNLRNNWKDEDNTSYAQKYNSEAKVSAENVEKLMREFANILQSSAEAFEEVKKRARQDIG